MKKFDYVISQRISLCRTIVELRKGAKLSQKELALRVGISTAHLCRIESGKVNISLDIFLNILFVLCFRLKVVSDLPF